MAFSLKKGSRSKSQIALTAHNDTESLGEVLHRSTKTKKIKKTKKKLLDVDEKLPSPDKDHGPTILSPLNANPIIYRSQCLCGTHPDKRLLEHSYDLTVDKLFDLLFGSNDFIRTYRQAQRFFDDTATEWTKNEVTNRRERTLSYKVPYESTLIGKSTIFTREKQILFHEVPGSYYMLETEVCNEGVKFSDTFSLKMRYCLVQTSLTKTNLLVTAQIVYIKQVNGLIKPIIERNAYSASQEGLKDLNNRLNIVADYKTEQRGLSKNEITCIVPTTEIVRRISQTNLLPLHQSLPVDNNNRNAQSSNSDEYIYIVVFLLGILFLLMHIYLHIRLHHTLLLADKLTHFLEG